MFLKKRLRGVTRLVLTLAVMACALLAFVGLTGLTASGATREGVLVAEASIRRAAVQCYALEGAYPTSYDYLVDHYGVSIDAQLYVVDYQFLAGNLMPSFAVLPYAEEVSP